VDVEQFLRWLADFDPLPMASNPRHPARRNLELFLASKSLTRFSRSDLARKVGAWKWAYAHSKDWIGAGVFIPDGREKTRLAWGRPPGVVTRERRGRPALLFKSVDPLEGRTLRPAQFRALAPLIRSPLVADALANSLRGGLRLLVDADGRELLRGVARMVDRTAGKSLSDLIGVFEQPIDPTLRDCLPEKIGRVFLVTLRECLPRLADTLESVPAPRPPP